MTKIAFIGAGSLGFTRGLVRDILTFPLLRDATLSLMDIDPERLDFAKRSVGKIVALGNYPAQVEATLDRAEAPKDADFVLVTILAGGTDIWRYDIEIPKQYGIDINIGDTRGPAGIFRALRTIPVMLEVARDMERYCTGLLGRLAPAYRNTLDVRVLQDPTGQVHGVHQCPSCCRPCLRHHAARAVQRATLHPDNCPKAWAERFTHGRQPGMDSQKRG